MRLIHIAMLAGTALLAAGLAQAAESHGDQDRRDLKTLDGLAIPLQQAITAAEQQSGGRALSADLLERQGVPYVAVEVGGPQGIRTVIVDGRSGQVAAGLAASEDGNEDGETDDD